MNIGCAKSLIENGADYKAKNKNGQTPIDTITDPSIKKDLTEFIDLINCR